MDANDEYYRVMKRKDKCRVVEKFQIDSVQGTKLLWFPPLGFETGIIRASKYHGYYLLTDWYVGLNIFGNEWVWDIGSLEKI